VSDLARTLDAVEAYVRSYVVMGEAESVALTLHALHTHVFDAADTTPYLSVTSAEMESGKTLLLETLEPIVARAWLTGRVTAAVLARKVDKERPTLLLDESDAAFNGDREYAETLRGILNTGYKRSGKASVCVGQGANIGYADLSTFCPKVIAGIGELPATVASRSISIRLKRRTPDEPVERWRRREVLDIAEPLYQALVSLGEHYVERLAVARPALPPELPDRAADVWEPLLAIADLAGGEWPERARAAARLLMSRRTTDDEAIGVQLLTDCRPVFDGNDRLSTKELRELLIADEEKPWATWHHGSPISPRALARMLHRFEIRSRTIRLEDGTTPKGYMRESFEDAWKRYVAAHPRDSSAQTPQRASEKGLSPVAIRHATPLVADSEYPTNQHGCSDVADSEDKSGGRGNGSPERLLAAKPARGASEADYWAERIRTFEVVPRFGEEGFPELIVATALDAGHILEAEANERYALHKLVTREKGTA
jgi:hypothetical protein